MSFVLVPSNHLSTSSAPEVTDDLTKALGGILSGVNSGAITPAKASSLLAPVAWVITVYYVFSLPNPILY